MQEYIVVSLGMKVSLRLHDARLTYEALGIEEPDLDQIGVVLTKLGKQGFRVVSSGPAAGHGFLWTMERLLSARQIGEELSKERSR